MISTKNKIFYISVITIFFAFVFSFISNGFIVNAETAQHSSCPHNVEYCLVCDIAQKINELPDANDITINNAASAIQQIYNIDRIKFDLTDSQYAELITMVEYNNEGGENVVRYNNTINKIKSLTNSGINFAITKKFDLGKNVVINNTSKAEVSFNIVNLSSNETTTLTLFDLDVVTSKLAADGFYSAEASGGGWTFNYIFPSGTYRITEINTDKPITINEQNYLLECSSMTYGNQVVKGNGMVVNLTDQQDCQVTVLNKLCHNLNGGTVEGNTISFNCPLCNTVEGNDVVSYTLTAPTENLIYDGTTLFNTATVTTSADDSTHFIDIQTPAIVYNYKENNDDEYATATDFTQAGYYMATFEIGGKSVSVEYEVHKHNFIKQSPLIEFIKSEATCTSAAVYYRYCDCGIKSTNDADTFTFGTPLGHSFAEYVSDNNATCTVDGTKTAECEECGETNTITDENSARGHSFTEYVSDNNATCTVDGTKTAECEECGETNTITDENSARGHNYGMYGKTETEHWKHCVNDGCGYIDETTRVSHSFGDWVVTTEATETETGEQERKCLVCGHKQSETIPTADNGLSGGAIAGIVAGSVIVVGNAGFAIFWFVIKKKKWADLFTIFKRKTK